ncbi:MAG TPA: VOC family protein [Sphingomicrobium sp.]|nr:VOC family protein [Sphingomicrobium sp.]
MSEVRTQAGTAPATQSSGNPQGDFIWYELMTPDPEGAKAFYDAVVGWNVGEAMPGPFEYRIIGRSDGGNAGGVLRLTEDMAKHGARPTWLGYIHVPDVDAAVSAIEPEGGHVHMAPSDIPDVGRVAMVADPQGALFYLMKPIPPADKPDARSDVFAPDGPGRCAWNELATSDQKAALDFYTSQFGWTAGDTMPMGDMGEYQFILQDGQMIGAMMTKAAENPVRWRFYFRVIDVDSAKAAVERSGGTIIHGPQEVPGGDRVLIGRDPQGAEFAVVGK